MSRSKVTLDVPDEEFDKWEEETRGQNLQQREEKHPILEMFHSLKEKEQEQIFLNLGCDINCWSCIDFFAGGTPLDYLLEHQDSCRVKKAAELTYPLRQRRKEKGLTLGQLAEALNMSVSALSSMEREKQSPTKELLDFLGEDKNNWVHQEKE